MSIPVEIERKYVIVMPDTDTLRSQSGYTVSEIEQTYIESAEHVTHRVRARRYADRLVYTETKKVRIDKMSAIEDEREISRAEYELAVSKKKTGTHTVRKTRHTFEHAGQIFEIDVYPEWVRTAVMETELESRGQTVSMPDFIRIVAEVTGDKKYSNASMSQIFPDELM